MTHSKIHTIKMCIFSFIFFHKKSTHTSEGSTLLLLFLRGEPALELEHETVRELVRELP